MTNSLIGWSVVIHHRSGGERHSALYYRWHCSIHGALRPNGVLVAAPLIACQTTKHATSSGVVRFSGRRSCGTRQTLRSLLGRRRARHSNPECNAPPLLLWYNSGSAAARGPVGPSHYQLPRNGASDSMLFCNSLLGRSPRIKMTFC
jgi:hypothetical protein